MIFWKRSGDDHELGFGRGWLGADCEWFGWMNASNPKTVIFVVLALGRVSRPKWCQRCQCCQWWRWPWQVVDEVSGESCLHGTDLSPWNRQPGSNLLSKPPTPPGRSIHVQSIMRPGRIPVPQGRTCCPVQFSYSEHIRRPLGYRDHLPGAPIGLAPRPPTTQPWIRATTIFNCHFSMAWKYQSGEINWSLNPHDWGGGGGSGGFLHVCLSPLKETQRSMLSSHCIHSRSGWAPPSQLSF